MTEWFGVEAFIPHGFCLSWDPELMAAIVLSNGLIALAYFVIAAMLALHAMKPDPLLPRWLYWAFAAFIFCCALTHVLDNVTLWFPFYRLQAVVLGVAALVSLFTAVLPVSVWVTRHLMHRRE